jgi:hypothetical protein
MRRTPCWGGSCSCWLGWAVDTCLVIVESIRASDQTKAAVGTSADGREVLRAGACSQVTAMQQFGRASFSPVLQHSCSDGAVPGDSKLMKQRPRTPARGTAKATARLNARSFNASCLISRYQSIGP